MLPLVDSVPLNNTAATNDEIEQEPSQQGKQSSLGKSWKFISCHGNHSPAY